MQQSVMLEQISSLYLVGELTVVGWRVNKEPTTKTK